MPRITRIYNCWASRGKWKPRERVVARVRCVRPSASQSWYGTYRSFRRQSPAADRKRCCVYHTVANRSVIAWSVIRVYAPLFQHKLLLYIASACKKRERENCWCLIFFFILQLGNMSAVFYISFFPTGADDVPLFYREPKQIEAKADGHIRHENELNAHLFSSRTRT